MARAFLFYIILGFALSILFFRLFHRWQNKTVYLVADKTLKEYAPRNTVLFFKRLGFALPLHTINKVNYILKLCGLGSLKKRGKLQNSLLFCGRALRSLLAQKEQPILYKIRLCVANLRFHFRQGCKFAPWRS